MSHNRSDKAFESFRPMREQASSVAPAASSPNPNHVSQCFVHSLFKKRCLAALSSDESQSKKTPENQTPYYEDEDEENESLTKQLAETAQSVREMNKELGRRIVRSRIQHVLIVTKVNDNQLVSLTRELALHLMQKSPSIPKGTNSRYGTASLGRGMVVYVDSEFETSKAFDVPGLQRDHPELFEPMISNRSSSSLSSMNTLNESSTDEEPVTSGSSTPVGEGQLRYWTNKLCSNTPHLFDLVITLGGDGTVLYTSWLFQRIVPPVLPFALGSLGFLTKFDFKDYKEIIDKVIRDGIRVSLRMRFCCTVYRTSTPGNIDGPKAKKRRIIKDGSASALKKRVHKSGWESLEDEEADSHLSDAGSDEDVIMRHSTRPEEQFEVLNELVVDRGPNSAMSSLELFGDEYHLTTVQADGLTVSTPTGSTAYSLSAGGSLTSPQTSNILITPICPHTLSFRPVVLEDSIDIRVCVPFDSRTTAWTSFDGRSRLELKQGDHIKVTASRYPFPIILYADKSFPDWASSLSRKLRWNERERQKPYVLVEEARQQK
ncbi:NAD+ kinase [Cryptococcus neoformans C23]|uniref:NAD kinase n=1 Tax=Cryptococcus neoformans (strain H99 / ATCC 208821 / CBS 10515 / FGSC 9487) TaxID=235443 RepID=J9VZ80_CRYN9|nr:NAD kinase [Cryptococcus neoformans var. grubii H99]AUB27023.1 NAD kinase [Cryptococcus neoformans var. grubii]OWZ29351.1 NAD+ kinase [Cryptococcus neoformans var. grubii AD2-60a]OWZ41217.1 NAD+ kinase [Cryptococcus neoformans var. grubii C23]OXC82918.1 NAD+ kinase [Cryptococcus neoformans var. grubii AD1-7a]OXG29428.1 NAD+ kinase [Cryptococcus neoformans var. grubii Bt15]OXG37452.1 NAD+ kinase [Cryptococcus neoformans var. grubii Bt120]|eukprot:XP_012051488.1 NAD kinase [Cryptococcus neoformans var. grubii H99]